MRILLTYAAYVCTARLSHPYYLAPGTVTTVTGTCSTVTSESQACSETTDMLTDTAATVNVASQARRISRPGSESG